MTGAVPAGELLGCPLCGDTPVRNGRGVVGGVLCAGIGSHPHMSHRVQSYGGTQAEADAAWNTRVPATPSPQPVAEVEGVIHAAIVEWCNGGPIHPHRLAGLSSRIAAALGGRA